MFDVVIVSGPDPDAAARTLATLVEGVVEGLLRRAILASTADGADLRRLADEAGCRAAAGVAESDLGRTIADLSETPHLLVMKAGALVPPGWTDMLYQDLKRRGPPAIDSGVAFRPAALPARLRIAAAMATARPMPLDHGAIVPRAALRHRSFNGERVPTARGWRMARLTVER
ncbi:MAG: hypothetical protein ACRCTI_03880 [Beijerinckiaceae bacterium]